jgi:AcrR family transcriptional regulator
VAPQTPKRATGRPKAARKRARRYHHGDLRRALLQETLRTIQAHGVEGLTLRGVGQKLGVSRTALYRHFADKAALLGTVSGEGFRTLHAQLAAAWKDNGEGGEAFAAMGIAYVQFAVANPSHYRVMFGSGLDPDCAPDPELQQAAAGAFQALVDAIVSQQRQGSVRPDEPLMLARFIWSLVHGIAMLAIDGRLSQGEAIETFTRFALERSRTGITEG